MNMYNMIDDRLQSPGAVSFGYYFRRRRASLVTNNGAFVIATSYRNLFPIAGISTRFTIRQQLIYLTLDLVIGLENWLGRVKTRNVRVSIDCFRDRRQNLSIIQFYSAG